MPNGQEGDGIHTVDLDRLRSLRDPNIEEVAIRFHHKEKKLILRINGIERNNIKVSDPEDKFEACIRWIKEQFILWRTPKN